MNSFDWIAPLKEAVLLLYFLLFTGILVWTMRLRGIEDQNIPFADEEVSP